MNKKNNIYYESYPTTDLISRESRKSRENYADSRGDIGLTQISQISQRQVASPLLPSGVCTLGVADKLRAFCDAANFREIREICVRQKSARKNETTDLTKCQPLTANPQLPTTSRLLRALCTLCAVVLFASCSEDEAFAPANTTDDVLATMDANTRVGVFAEVKGQSGEGKTDTRALTSETRSGSTTYYDYYEIHPSKEVLFTMIVPGASDVAKMQLQPMDENGYTKLVSFNTLATTEPFSSLRLKDFNLTEGENRCVSRWTVLDATYSGRDKLWGWARLTADATGQPVLDYGEMKRASAKVTIIVQDEQGAAVNVSGGKVSATLSLPWTISDVIYTPEEAEQGTSFDGYCYNNIFTLAADEAIESDCIGLAVFANGTTNTDFYLEGMVTADYINDRYYGENNNTLSAIVPVTATHTPDESYKIFTPIANPQFTDADKLTITVNTDPDGDTGPQTTGTYSLKLSDVKLSDGSNLTSLEAGEHYTLTVTLRHNKLVSATATIGAWSQASASATLGGDDAKMPPYTYDAETKTYTVYEEAGIEGVLADMEANPDRADATVMMNGTAVTLAGDAASLNAWATAVSTAITNGTTQPNLVLTADITLPTDGITVTDGVPSGSNWTPIGTEVGKFTGTIDGRGHTLSGLRISSTTSATGFIGWLGTGGVVKNLTLADAVVYSTEYVIGTVAGCNLGTVMNCHVAAGSSVATTSNQAGGIVGSNDYGGLLMGCTNAAAVTGTKDVGGIAGANGFGGIIVACANTGTVTNTGNYNASAEGYTYACWSTDNDDSGSNYGTNACNIIGTEINAETLAAAITFMNAAIDSYNASAAEGKTCPYRWTAVEGKAYPVLTTSSNE